MQEILNREAVPYPTTESQTTSTVSFRNTGESESDQNGESDEIDREIEKYFQSLPASEDEDLDRKKLMEIFGEPDEEAVTDLSTAGLVEEEKTVGEQVSPDKKISSSDVTSFANVSDEENEIVSHRVQKGDTIWGLSRKYNVKSDEILKNNPELRSRPLFIGEQILIKSQTKSKIARPAYHIRYHRVVQGDTLSGIARKYNVSLNSLMGWNDMNMRSIIRPGERIKLVFKKKGPPAGHKYAPYFIWPIKGRITSWFGRRRNPFLRSTRHFHKGLDISGALGTPIHAARDGIVILEGRMGGYGNAVFIRHANGYVSIYGHNKLNLVKKGDTVKQGQVIAEVGRTGTATGPHLHFEIRKLEKPINPIAALKMQEVVPIQETASRESR